MFDIHICFVSDQPLPNILPLLNETLRPKTVYLLASPQQTSKGNTHAQSQVIKELGLQVIVKDLDSAFDMNTIQHTLQGVLDENQHATLVYNATGGTKPMSIAAYELCYSDNIHTFYLQTPDLIWLHNPSKKLQDITLNHSLKLGALLACHGVSLLNSDTNQLNADRQELARLWAGRAEKQARLYGTLNYYAYQATKSLQVEISARDQHINELLYELENREFLTFMKKSPTGEDVIKFTNENSRSFTNGGWLEEHLFTELSALQRKYPQITDVARNVKVEIRPHKTRSSVKNELDVVAVVDNRLWVFECKTKSFTKAGAGKRDGEEMIYKLASLLKDMGGLRTQGCVVSFNLLRPEEKSRGELLNVTVVDGKNLKNLRSQLVGLLQLKKSPLSG